MEKIHVIEKKQIREQIRLIAHSYDWHSISLGVLKHLEEYSIKFPRNAVIGAYWPIKDEVNILPFLEKWSHDEGKISLPFVEQKDAPLLFYPWAPQSRMEIGHYQIPVPSQRIEAIFPDILLVPFSAFDKEGYRLGRGAGFYDRTIRKLRQEKNIYVIGLGSDQQLISLVPHESHDEKMDCVITDKKIYVF